MCGKNQVKVTGRRESQTSIIRRALEHLRLGDTAWGLGQEIGFARNGLAAAESTVRRAIGDLRRQGVNIVQNDGVYRIPR